MGNPRLRHLHGIAVDRVGREADEAHDPAILRLENLDTNLPPPPLALAATRRALSDRRANSYLPFLGIDELRAAVTAHVSRTSGIAYDWRRSCVISAGGLSGVLSVLLALIHAEDEVIVTDPTYVGLLNRIRLAGVPKFAPWTFERDEWRLNLAPLRAAVTPKTRVLLIMSPSMPCGGVLNMDEWNAVAEICNDLQMTLVYDSAMERIVFDGRPVTAPASVPGMDRRTITVGSVSNEYRMIGWRVGWIVGPADLMNDVGLVSIANVVTPVGIAQHAAAAVLNGAQDHVYAAVGEWQRRRDVLLEELKGLAIHRPQGGWSMLLDVSRFTTDAESASRRLMEISKVAATPDDWLGKHKSRQVRPFRFFQRAGQTVARDRR